MAAVSDYVQQPCYRCRTQNQPGSSFCSFCSADLTIVPQPAMTPPASPDAVATAPVIESGYQQNLGSPQPISQAGYAAPPPEFAGYQHFPDDRLVQFQLGQIDNEIAKVSRTSGSVGLITNFVGGLVVTAVVFFGSLFSAMISFAACVVALIVVGAVLRATSRILGAWWNSFWGGFLIGYWAAYIGGLSLIVGDSAFFGGSKITAEDLAVKELMVFMTAVAVASLAGMAVFLIRKERVRAALVESLQSDRDALSMPAQAIAADGSVSGYGEREPQRTAPRFGTSKLKGWQTALILAGIFLLPAIVVVVVMLSTGG